MASIQMRNLIFATIFLLLSFSINTTPDGITREYNKDEIKTLIKKYCKRYKLNAELVLSIVDYESEFFPKMKNPKSTSSGLFGQIKSTLSWTAKMEGYKLNCLANTLPIEEQIYFGTRYIKYLDDKYKGNEKSILLEYCNESSYYKQIQIRKIKYKREI